MTSSTLAIKAYTLYYMIIGYKFLSSSAQKRPAHPSVPHLASVVLVCVLPKGVRGAPSGRPACGPAPPWSACATAGTRPTIK